MKKVLLCLIVLTVLLLSFPVSAHSENAYLITMREEDMKGSKYQLFMMNCSGHYDADTDSAALYIGNLSNKKADFEICIGWEGNNPITFVRSGAVTLEPGQMGKFVLTGLYAVPEKANDELGYVPGSHLSGNSVIRICVSNAEEGMSFLLAGLNAYGYFRNTYFVEPKTGFIRPAGLQNVDGARLVIADEDTAKANEKITLGIPETGKVQMFLNFTVLSAVLCAGGLILFTVRYFVKEKKHDGTEQV